MIYDIDKGRRLLIVYVMPIAVCLPLTVGLLLKHYPDKENRILSLVPVFYICLAAVIGRAIRAKAKL